MEGYTNLSLIKEEDFNKLGVGHLQGKNAIKRVYQNKRANPIHNNLKSRKASEATTITQNGGPPGSRNEYSSVDNRYETPLKLPNLRSTGTKKNSGTSNTSPLQYNANGNTNLSTVVENAYTKNHVHTNGNICKICARKHRTGQQHHSKNPSFSQVGSGGPLVKGAPYYQPIMVQQQRLSGKPRDSSHR